MLRLRALGPDTRPMVPYCRSFQLKLYLSLLPKRAVYPGLDQFIYIERILKSTQFVLFKHQKCFLIYGTRFFIFIENYHGFLLFELSRD
jgi:hypothetical protein